MIRFSSSPLMVEYSDGKIWGYKINDNDEIEKKEYAYCHLQKRKIDILTNCTNQFIILNELFLPIEMKEICLEKLKIQNVQIKHDKYKNKKYNKINHFLPFLKEAKISLLIRMLRIIGYKKKFAYEK